MTLTDSLPQEDYWAGDKLGYKDIGHAFTNLVRSIDTEKVISIEAGFGRGKTFFRKAWAQQLENEGEVVIQVDVQQSDHSGDPVITLLGALVDALPKSEKGKGQKAFESAKKIGAIGAKAVLRAALKSGADEVLDALGENAIDRLNDFDALDGFIKDVGDDLSKVAAQLISAQMATEKVRKKELPDQIEALRSALVEKNGNNRVIVIIDELDRCHPEYAIAFLEATKLIFNQSGFVFCLMVNADYLENLAQHRFGVAKEDEKYLDKFVDIRLKLAPQPEAIKSATYDMALNLPLNIPYGDTKEFSLGAAAELASNLAMSSGLSMRKIERILLRVEVALRCYADRPLDAPLLVRMAFQDEAPNKLEDYHLPRFQLSPKLVQHVLPKDDAFASFDDEEREDARLNAKVNEIGPELLSLPRDRYRLPDNGNYKPWALIFEFLARHYIPEHRAVLDAVAAVLVDDT